MKKVMGAAESAFCAGYLIFAFVAGFIFLGRGGALYRRCAAMTLLLAGGDAFHLVPRILAHLKPDWAGKERWLGLGNLVSSITMTLFYIELARVMDCLEPGRLPPAVLPTLVSLAALRVGLCACPANRWLGDGGSQKWRLYRNLPFAGMGVVTVLYLAGVYGRWGMAALVFASFAFYLAVVLGVRKNAKLGMLMIPKTVCYIWLIALFL